MLNNGFARDNASTKIALKAINKNRRDDDVLAAGHRCRLSCSWAEEVPDMPIVADQPRPKNHVFKIFLGIVVFIGTVVFLSVVAITLANRQDDGLSVSVLGAQNSTKSEEKNALEIEIPYVNPKERKTCRIVVLFAKTGVEASTDGSYLEFWKSFRLTPAGKSLINLCDFFEFDARSDAEVVFDIISNFVFDDKRSLIVIGVGDYALGEKLAELLTNSSAIVFSPQNSIPDSTQILSNERNFQLKVDAILAKAAASRAKRILPIVCDHQSRKFNAFLRAAANFKTDLEILPPISALTTIDTDIPDVENTVIATFCGRELPAALLWAKISVPRLITRPWMTFDAYDFKDLSDNDVVARRVGPMVGLFTPVRLKPNCGSDDDQKIFGKFLRSLTKIIPKTKDPKELSAKLREMLQNEPLREKEEVAIASMPLLSRKSGKAVLIRNQAWSIDSYLQFRRIQGLEYEFEGARVPHLGLIFKKSLEAELYEMDQGCESFWVSIQTADPFSCAVTSDTFMMGGTSLKDMMGFPEQILFLADGKFKGELVCLNGNQPADKFKIDLACSSTLDIVCKNISLTLESRGARALVLSETAIATRNQLTRLGRFIQASSPCIGVGLFCTVCLDAVGRAVTEMTVTACSAACLVASTVTCIGFVLRESGDLLRDLTNLGG